MFEKLNQRKEAGNIRKLTLDFENIDFLSNDYLGLARNIDLSLTIDKAWHNVQNKRQLNGSTGSRLLSGNSNTAEQIEDYLAQLFDSESSLIFPSGYIANLSILSCLPQKSDTIIHDELIHASLIDGARLSYARRLSFRHNDCKDLEKKIRLSSGQKYVVVESIYSMDGDECPLKEVIEICNRHDALLIVDEAHSTGVVGQYGAGLLYKNNLHKEVFARIYTFGKAMGIHGACICGSSLLKEYLINFARPFIYSTAMPIAHYIAIETSFRYLQEHHYLQQLLSDNILYFKKCINNTNKELTKLLLPSNSAIQILITSGNEYTTSISKILRINGYEVRAILSPTVPIGQERLRICVHAYNTKEEIEGLVQLLHTIL